MVTFVARAPWNDTQSGCRRDQRELRTYFEGTVVLVVLNDAFEIAGHGLEEIVHVVLCLNRIAQATVRGQRATPQTMHLLPYRNAFFNVLRPDEDSIMLCMVFVAAAIASLHLSSYVANELRTTAK